MKTRLKSPDVYTIGWIAALPIERAAATALLHDRHDAPEGFDQHRSDTNSYTWGRISEHNIVIASLPAGVYGTTAAATTASNLIHSLPHIRIGLLVGIGGGIARPDEGQDIRLGDIVVSQPDGTTGGVVQYDLGKAKADGSWERKGSLEKPPSVLLHALASLQAEHEIGPSKVPDLLQAMLEANPGMRRPKTDFTYQGTETDRLFEPQHNHVGGSNCNKCDSAREVGRDQRESSDPEIHYGIIASGNKLIKDAATRDSLFGDMGHQCLCVEMEAAGLMDRFPCLVIRGICDYADSHKNDRWQRYAAATAAAFAVELLEYVPVAQLEATQKAIEAIQSLHGDVGDLKASINNIDHHITLDHLPNAEGASFDSHAEEHNSTCLPDTREELLREIDRWIVDPDSKTIFWLNGMAGTGKSTISRTVARSRSKKGDLGASFFFKRGETDRGNLAKFVPTVARRLAWSVPNVAPFIKSAVDADPAIADKAAREQPELAIRLGFVFIKGTYQDLILQEIPYKIIEHDISVFLRHEFANIRSRFNKDTVEELKLAVDWPGESNLEKLTRAAVPLFIFAATLCRFVNDSCLGSPDELLQSVLHRTGNSQASKLDMTYSPVLEQQVVNRSGREKSDIIESFRLIVGTIITLASPLPMHALALLLNVHVNKVATRLKALHSVLEVPESLESPVRLLHLSFRDYLVDPENRETAEFWVDEIFAHRKLAEHCLRVMRGMLRENICGLSFPGMRRSAVGARQLEEHMPLQLQYACMYWVHHQMKGDSKLNDDNEVYDFLTTHFLHWLEAMSLLGRVKECLDSLRSLARWLENGKDLRLSIFVVDAVRFIQAYFSVIAEAPLQIYCCLVFAPSKDILRMTFQYAIPRWISMLPKVEENWNACLLTLEGHSENVNSVVFSHDSKKVASASADKTIRIWNAKTGECAQVLEDHSDNVNSVVFSHDSTKLASASYDETMQIWDAETGEYEQVLEDHSDRVNSVVFSHDSKKVASASADKTIRIWNAKTGECAQVLEDHSDNVNSVVFSHDSTKLASASYDETMQIWDAETGECERVLKGHRNWVNSVVFSHNSKKVASGSSDQMIRIWDVEIGECERVLEGHSDWVNSVVFSHDSKKIASGSFDQTIRIWDAKTGECEQVLEGHSKGVLSVVFSHDSIKLASSSNDRRIRIWNAKTGECERVLEGHSDSVESVVFSHDSTKLASGSFDQTIRIWDAEIGECKRVLEGHSSIIISMVFSHNLTKLASASHDKTVRIWDTKTGECERVLEGHSEGVASVVFSHDLTKLASASRDKTIRIWDAKTGECERVLEGHSESVLSVVFSHDLTKLASASHDKTVRIWDAKTGECERVLEGHSKGVASVVFSHDLTKLASASHDSTIRIWDAKTGKCKRVLEGHIWEVRSVVFSYDSKKVASAAGNESIRIWDTETGDCEDIFPVDFYVDVLSFTPDERGIVTNCGVFNLIGGSRSCGGSAILWKSSEASMLSCTDSTWVTAAGKDLLWLPPECRNGNEAVSGSTVAIGCKSGRVMLLRISMAEDEWTDM
ncbi:G-protein beta WD-40 repeat [Fusarium oxysporum f. sp. vasinfectum]|nr:G-protein beta WD-40 repeat [Fusarium oxysporum f. sp. vasinfectum]